jgi:tetratricopeptide (TPR) repeat protein
VLVQNRILVNNAGQRIAMNRPNRATLTVLCAVLASVALAPAGHAEPRGKRNAESHYNKGMKAYNLGHFPEAIEEFEKAYELAPEPILLYNIAQSHRQDGNAQRAAFFYRRYLEAAPDAKNRAEIEKRLAELQSQIDAPKDSPAIAPPPAPVPPPVVAPPPVPAPPPVVVQTTQPAQVPPPSQGRGLRIAGLVTGGVGVAAAITGTALVLYGRSQQSSAMSGTWDASKYDSGKSMQTVGWIAVGVGGAAVVTGTILYVVGAKSASVPGTLSLAPLVTPDAGGAVLLGRF